MVSIPNRSVKEKLTMPKKKNFLGGMQNYNPNTGEYEPALKGPNGESPSGFKSFKKGKPSYNANDEDSIWESFEKGEITEEERNKLLGERSKNIVEKGNKTTKEKWDEYINNGFNGDNVEYYNNLIQEIENELPFKNQQEHDKWLDMGMSWNGEQEWLDMTEEIISRQDKDESFDSINNKRMGKETESFDADAFEDELQDLSNEHNTSGLDDAEYVEELNRKRDELEKNKDKLDDETYNRINNRINKSLGLDGETKESGTKYFRHPEVDGVWHDTGKTTERNGNTYKIFENEEGNTWAVSERFSKQFEEVDMSKEPELLSEEYLDKFYELANGDEDKMTELIRKDKRYQEGNGYGAGEENFSMGDLQGIVEGYMMKKTRKGTVDRYKEKFGKSAFDENNAKRIGKEQLKDKNQTTGRKYDNLFGYTQDEFKKFYEQGRTIIGTSNKFYEIQYSPAQQKFYAAELNYKNDGFAKKGRHHILSPKDANHVLGKKVFWEE